MKVLVLGAGKMVEAILDGLYQETDLAHYYIYSPSGVSAKKLALKTGCQYISSLDECVDPTWVWLGCKPQGLKDLALMIGGRFSNSVFVSMLAAVGEKDQLNILGAKKLIRIMPNLPIKYKKGITLLSSKSAKEELKKIKTLFSLVGLVREVEESELEELTLLSGSGPALFYEFTQVLASSFHSLGQMDREELARMVLQGASETCSSDSRELNSLVHDVTSKGGVTIAVLEQWRQQQLKELIGAGLDAGRRRTSEIKENLLRS